MLVLRNVGFLSSRFRPSKRDLFQQDLGWNEKALCMQEHQVEFFNTAQRPEMNLQNIQYDGILAVPISFCLQFSCLSVKFRSRLYSRVAISLHLTVYPTDRR